jgi:hypothetical protein
MNSSSPPSGHPSPRNETPRGAPHKLKLLELWQRTSQKTGKAYLSGFLGDLSLIAFSKERPHPKRPDKRVIVWTVFAEEKDPTRWSGGGG